MRRKKNQFFTLKKIKKTLLLSFFPSQVPLLAYGAYQEQLARYPWLLWADRAAAFLESKGVASGRRGILGGALKGGVENGGGDDDGSSSSIFKNAAFLSPLFLLLAAAASALAPLFRSLATAIDLLLDAATAARLEEYLRAKEVERARVIGEE